VYSEFIVNLHGSVNPLRQQGQFVVYSILVAGKIRVLFSAEEFHSNQAGDLECQANLAFQVATLDFLQGPSGYTRSSRQVFLGHFSFFPLKPDELTQKLGSLAGQAKICSVPW
jgi:hypothetical protein